MTESRLPGGYRKPLVADAARLQGAVAPARVTGGVLLQVATLQFEAGIFGHLANRRVLALGQPLANVVGLGELDTAVVLRALDRAQLRDQVRDPRIVRAVALEHARGPP